MKLITFIIGTRPEAIKLAPLINIFKKDKDFITRVILSGQHRDLVKEVLSLFQISFNKDLNIMKVSQTLESITINVLEGLNSEFLLNRPDLVVVQGDTSTAFTAALASFYLKIPIAHVEAGLRTDNIYEPFPEEINRKLITQLAHLHFAPTETAAQKCKSSGAIGNIYVTGNTVVDALKFIGRKTKTPEIKGISWDNDFTILATIHRRENLGQSLKNIVDGFIKILNNSENTKIIIPMHPNPLVRKIIEDKLSKHPKAFLINSQGYKNFLGILKAVNLVLTDSGGLQEESPSLNKPVLVLRNTTERTEVIETGACKLIGTNKDDIYNETLKLINNDNLYNEMANADNPYGDGTASLKILNFIRDFFNNNKDSKN